MKREERKNEEDMERHKGKEVGRQRETMAWRGRKQGRLNSIGGPGQNNVLRPSSPARL